VNRQQAFLLVLILSTAALCLFVVLPFVQYVLAGIIVAYILYPINRRLEPHLGGTVSPVAVITGLIVAIVLPLGYIVLVLYRDLQSIASGQSSLDITTVISRLEPVVGSELQSSDAPEIRRNVAEEALTVLFGGPSQVFSTATQSLLGLLLTVFLVYYLLKDGPGFVKWAAGIAPLDEAVTRRLLFKIDRTTRGVVVSHLAVAFLQGVLGGFGLFVVGISIVVFWTFVMIVLALLPLIGAFFVWGPAAAYLLAIDQTGAGTFLLFYGLIVVSLVDNYARPLIIDQSAQLNPGIILVGVLGGLYSIGFTGLFVGPIVFGVLAATLTAFRDDYEALAYDTPPPDHPDLDGKLEWLIGHQGDHRPADGTAFQSGTIAGGLSQARDEPDTTGNDAGAPIQNGGTVEDDGTAETTAAEPEAPDADSNQDESP
jgi:predicted PurR-regulated permease PerM